MDLRHKTVLPSTLDNLLAFMFGKDTDPWLRLTYLDRADGVRFEVGGPDHADQ